MSGLKRVPSVLSLERSLDKLKDHREAMDALTPQPQTNCTNLDPMVVRMHCGVLE